MLVRQSLPAANGHNLNSLLINVAGGWKCICRILAFQLRRTNNLTVYTGHKNPELKNPFQSLQNLSQAADASGSRNISASNPKAF